MPRWNTPREMAVELELRSDPDDRDAIAREIRTEIATLHPDHQGGSFADPNLAERYNLLSEGLQFLARGGGVAMIPVGEVTALLTAVREVVHSRADRETPAHGRAEFRELTRVSARHRIALPRIGSGAFAGLFAFFLAFGSKFKDDPLLGHIVNTPHASLIVLEGLLVSALLFCLTWVFERRAEARAEWLTTEAGRHAALRDVLLVAGPRSERSGKSGVEFSLSEMTTSIMHLRQNGEMNSGRRLRSGVWPFTEGLITLTAAERLAKAHLDVLEERGAIRRLPLKRVELTFEMDGAMAREFIANRGG